MVMVQALRESAPAPSLVAPLVYGITTTAHNFRNVNFSHVRRTRNKSAHLLARHAYGIINYCAWIEESHCFFRTSSSP